MSWEMGTEEALRMKVARLLFEDEDLEELESRLGLKLKKSGSWVTLSGREMGVFEEMVGESLLPSGDRKKLLVAMRVSSVVGEGIGKESKVQLAQLALGSFGLNPELAEFLLKEVAA